MNDNSYQPGRSRLPRVRIDLRDIFRLECTEGYHTDVVNDLHMEGLRPKIFFIPSRDKAVNNDVHRSLVLCDAIVSVGPALCGYELPMKEHCDNIGSVNCVVMVLLGDYLACPKDKASDFPITSPAPAVIFWLGYLTAVLGGRKVVVLHEDGSYFRCPTNYFDVTNIPLDNDGRWRDALQRHLRSLGVRVNENPSISSFFNMKAVV